MSMFCMQCQETARGTGCTIRGVCGKDEGTAGAQDALVYALKGLSVAALASRKAGKATKTADRLVMDGLFACITNANFDEAAIDARVKAAVAEREALIAALPSWKPAAHELEATTWKGGYAAGTEKAAGIGVLSTADPDIRSLRELLTYGIKGMAAYAHHAAVLGKVDDAVLAFMERGLASTLDKGLGASELTALVLECGAVGVKTMALLDAANTAAYGQPEITKVRLGVGKRPGILVSGHDLKDLEMLLRQSEGKGVDIYTHSEMLPAHYYPAFKKFSHFYGNYGNAWWRQKDEFERFHGPILMTTNCIVPPADSYKARLFTTGVTGYPGCPRIEAGVGGYKDFSPLIEAALHSPPPEELETGEIVGGFAHGQVLALADKIIAAVKSGAIRKFVVMAGCDGRMKERSYYEDFAKALPKDTVILTAGCAKYRYIKLGLGDIGGIPRVLDAGQCNDSYSLVMIALALKEAFGLKDLNELPIAFNIAWYEQKAVLVLLALLSLGVKHIHLGPSLPAFLSPGVAKVLVDTFGIGGISTVSEDMKLLIG